MNHSLPHKMIWANLVHLSYNMWFDCPVKVFKPKNRDGIIRPYLRFDDRLWNDILRKMSAVGMNMVVLDLGDAVRYRSHPEIAVKNAWSAKRLKQELAKVRAMGIEPIPKLNFAASHDNWLGLYSRMVSTKPYYRVCRALIEEVGELFDGPRFFHLGMDEETAVNQIYNRHVVIRQYDLFWDDLYRLFDAVQKCGSRPWVWSDYQWYHPEEYFRKMPKSVLQSNWWYYTRLDPATTLVRCNPQDGNMTKALRLKPVKAYLELEDHGYDQVPTSSFCARPTHFAATVVFARRHISPNHLFGFMQTTWCPTLEKFRAQHIKAVERAGATIRQESRRMMKQSGSASQAVPQKTRGSR